MRRFLPALFAALTVALTTTARADDPFCNSCHPWGHLRAKHKAKKDPCAAEDARINNFWTDYYANLSRYYGGISRMDWQAYYSNHGQSIGNQAPGVQYHPVFFSPDNP
jgi:hypothetical protein